MGGNETRNLWLSVAFGAVAAMLFYSYTQEKKAEYDKMYGTKKVIIVAKEDISEMQTIYDNLLEQKEYPTEYLTKAEFANPDEIVGNVAAIPIKAGQPILKNMLYTPGPDTGIANQVAPNKRAVTIPVDEIRGVAKLIRPGDRVDIITAVDAGKGMNVRREVTTLLQDVSVLATGVSIVNNIPRLFELDSSGKNVTQISLTGDTKYSSITVEVSPKEAQDLIYILSTTPGNIFFTLRNSNDRVQVPRPGERLPSSTAESVLNKPFADSSSAVNPAPAFGKPGFMSAPIVPQKPAQKPQAPVRRNGFKTL